LAAQFGLSASGGAVVSTTDVLDCYRVVVDQLQNLWALFLSRSVMHFSPSAVHILAGANHSLGRTACLACLAEPAAPEPLTSPALFKHAKLTKRYSRHSDVPTPKSAPDLQPHDEWELDAQGWVVVDGLGKVCLVNVLDVISRLKVENTRASTPPIRRSKPIN
jgi:hypothetical protein